MKIVLSLCFFFIFSFSSSFSQHSTCLPNLSLGISFPPVTDSIQRNFSKSILNDLNVQHIRFSEDWALREPTKGVFNWKPLDDRILWASRNHYEVLLTIQSNAGSWACSSIKNPQSCVFKNNLDFKTYVDTLLKRYPGQIAKIQFGNEWQNDYWYKGNAQQFIDANNVLYQAVKQLSPSTKVVLGGFTTLSLRALALCSGKISSFKDDDGHIYTTSFCQNVQYISAKSRIDSVLTQAQYDIIDLHFYDDVENWGVYYQNFKDTITRPILVSEFSGPNLIYETPYSDSLQAHRFERYAKVLDSLQVKEAYYFKLVEGGSAVAAHQKSGLIDTNLNLKPSYTTFKSLSSCLTELVENQSIYNIGLFPNPMYSQCNLTFENPRNLPLSLTMYTVEGKIVRRTNQIIDNPVSIDKQGLSNGWYYIVLQSDQTTFPVQKLLVH